MRILFIGDIKRIRLSRWVKYLVTRGYEIEALSIKPATIPGVKIYYSRLDEHAAWWKRWIQQWLFFIKEQLIIRTGHYDIIHVQYLRSDISSWGATFHPRTIISVWGGDIEPGAALSTDSSWRWRRRALRRAAAITTVHRHLEEIIRKNAPEIKRVEIIPFGADVERFGRLRHLGAGTGSVRFCLIRPLEPQFGTELLIQAFARVVQRHSNISLMLIGEGNEKFGLHISKLIRELGLYRCVYIKGWVTEAEMNAILEESDVFVDLTLGDALGVMILEGLAAGLPVIAYRTGGVPDVVIEEITGYTIPPDDEKALVDALERMIVNPRQREYMSRNAREMAARLYSFNMHAERMEGLYQELLKKEKAWVK
ncbi:MAG: glycosyltransferase family 4 protein [Calditrichota bacterium]